MESINTEITGEGGKSFLVELMPECKAVTEKRKDIGRRFRPRYKVTEIRDIWETEVVTLAGTYTGKWSP